MEIHQEVLEGVAPSVPNGNLRRNVKRVSSESVQGVGSWVSVRVVTFGESKRISAEAAAAEGNQGAQIELTERLVREHLVDWSWCGDDGQLLPLPSADPTVLDMLTIEEISFLGSAINGNSDTPKG